MALKTPSYFDELERIRTHSEAYDPEKDYSEITSQLTAACLEFKYLAAAPQNLVAPAELLPVIVAKEGDAVRSFIRPKLVGTAGARRLIDACGNIFLRYGTRKRHPGVIVERPTYVHLSYLSPDGEEVSEYFQDNTGQELMTQSLTGALCHEIDHLSGRLIVDLARDRLVTALDILATAIQVLPDPEKDVRAYAYSHMPYTLVREGDKYMLRHGSEYEHSAIPPATEDALFADYFFGSLSDLQETFVPRGGELLPIEPSEVVVKMQS